MGGPLVPQTRVGKIEFYETHQPAWTTNAVVIGLTAPLMTAFTAQIAAARAAFTAAEVAREAAKAATTNFYKKVSEMQAQGSSFIDTIRATAISKNDANIYVLAQIPPPATPSSAPPPGTPFDFRVELQPTGSLSLSWKCNNPVGVGGTIYELKRRAGTGTPVYIGASGARTFVDDTLPSSAATGVTYFITGVRSTTRGVTAQFTVNFGVGGGGLSITSITEDAPARLAA